MRSTSASVIARLLARCTSPSDMCLAIHATRALEFARSWRSCSLETSFSASSHWYVLTASMNCGSSWMVVVGAGPVGAGPSAHPSERLTQSEPSASCDDPASITK